MHQTSQDGHIPFLPPIRDGSDLSLIVILEPTMGSHNYDDDAIFAVAEGIDLEALALFVTSLRDSGFGGDIVHSVLPREQMVPGLFNFLARTTRKFISKACMAIIIQDVSLKTPERIEILAVHGLNCIGYGPGGIVL